MLQQELFQKALPILKKIEQAGFEAYFVGGCVRDALLGRTISDVDIATSAFPQEIKAIFKRTVDVGIEHGTVMAIENGETYEITTFRTESTYQDYRRPDTVTFVRSLAEDLKRRDFTINALALDCRGKLYDFHQGQEDLKQKRIRAVGLADERFHEDALRMMRAIRFSGQLGFQIDTATQKGIAKNAHLLEKIAVERIGIEWEKLMLADHRAVGLDIFVATGLYRYCPYFAGQQLAIQHFSGLQGKQLPLVCQWAMLLLLFNGDEEKSSQILKAWKLSNDKIYQILTIINVASWRAARQWTVDDLFKVGKVLAELSEEVAYCMQYIPHKQNVVMQYEQLPIKSIRELALSGQDIMRVLNKKSGGKYLGEIIEAMRLVVLYGQVENTSEALTAWLQVNYKNLED